MEQASDTVRPNQLVCWCPWGPWGEAPSGCQTSENNSFQFITDHFQHHDYFQDDSDVVADGAIADAGPSSTNGGIDVSTRE